MFKSILVEDQQIKHLLSIIRSHYQSDNKNKFKEVNMLHVANRISDAQIRNYILDCWDELQRKLGHEVTLIENCCKKSIIQKLCKDSRDLSFAINTKPDNTSNEIHESIKKASNIDIVIKEFKL
ncbi:normocyte binding protein 2b [Francisella sp. TX07-6608]|uniref:normocyte binding protein 2b n=1 Tax=Francisella sp. TX07-6608 TaxID=573568 RepID=UPI0009206D4B|nr:normocyte binding protein 2b [Francisella sp. TX07-6608]OIN85022.1 hypothetical protein KX00_2211 [Francisella sp. TX07-6608]